MEAIHIIKTLKKDLYPCLRKGLNFWVLEFSGGEAGALKGPSLMVGGDLKAYQIISKDLVKIAAKDVNGQSCCEYLGSGGAGHYVKMVHNGIEYAEMQLIAEIFEIFSFRC